MNIDRQLLAAETEHQILWLRELLVRHDENLKAWWLLDKCVPYWLADSRAIKAAWKDQREMVLHAIDKEAYDEYYGQNPHERPFEEQYPGVTVENAHEHMYRVDFLRAGLEKQAESIDGTPTVLDLSSNDGWMAANLSLEGYTCDCLDLNIGAVDRANKRRDQYPNMGWCKHANFLFHDSCGRRWDAVVLFETLEHLADPAAGLRKMAGFCDPNGYIYVSTPLEAVEQGDLPTWAHVERKGHLWSFTASRFYELLEEVGEIELFEVGPDRVMCAQVKPREELTIDIGDDSKEVTDGEDW